MLNVDMKIMATIEGIRFPQKLNETTKEFEEDKSTFQIQTSIMNDKGVLERKTLKINKSLPIEQLEKMIGKTYVFTNIIEYPHKEKSNFNGKEFVKYTYTYSSDTFEELKNQPSQPIYEVQKKCEFNIVNIVKKEGREDPKTKKRTKDYVILQAKEKDGLSFKIYDIKVEDVSFETLKQCLNKKVLFENLTIKNSSNGLVIEANSMPKIVSTPTQAPTPK